MPFQITITSLKAEILPLESPWPWQIPESVRNHDWSCATYFPPWFSTRMDGSLFIPRSCRWRPPINSQQTIHQHWQGSLLGRERREDWAKQLAFWFMIIAIALRIYNTMFFYMKIHREARTTLWVLTNFGICRWSKACYSSLAFLSCFTGIS